MFTTWRVGGSRDVCALAHTTPNAIAHCSPHFTARPKSGFGTSGPSYSSTLSGTAIPELNGTLVECFGPHISIGTGNRVGNSTLQILGKHAIFIYILVREKKREKLKKMLEWRPKKYPDNDMM